jgi:3-methyladenine DNA glycosylase/8-oxoguanine DNA glycosylase
MRLAYGLRQLPKPAQMERIAATWRPYRSVASWYLCRALEVQPP